MAAAFVTALLGLGAFFAVGVWRSDSSNAEPPATESWHLELRPVEDDASLPCGRPPYRACAENAASTP